MSKKAETLMKKRPTKARVPSRSQPRTSRKPAAVPHSGDASNHRATPRIDPKWAWHYKILVDLRDRLLRRQDEQLREATEPIERHSMHDADSGTDEFDHDVALTLLAADQSALTEITDAIQRIVDGTYGACQATGERLPKERLRAIPWCRYSREVEERLEKRGEVRFPRVPRVYSIGGVEEEFEKAGEATESEGGQFKPEPGQENVERDSRASSAGNTNAAAPRPAGRATSKKRR